MDLKLDIRETGLRPSVTEKSSRKYAEMAKDRLYRKLEGLCEKVTQHPDGVAGHLPAHDVAYTFVIIPRLLLLVYFSAKSIRAITAFTVFCSIRISIRKFGAALKHMDLIAAQWLTVSCRLSGIL